MTKKLPRLISYHEKWGFERVRLFENPRIKRQMLNLKRMGYSISEIARKYGADHTTILHHCQAAGLSLTMKQRGEMNDLIRSGLTVMEVGERMGIESQVIEYYCVHYGVPGAEERFPGKKIARPELPRLGVNANARKKRMVEKVLFKTDERGIMWRTDETGEWICLGRSEYKEYRRNVSTVASREKKQALNQKRLEMLKY